MPELRSRARRNRAPGNSNPNRNPIAPPQPPELAVRTRQRRTTAQNRRNRREKNTIGAADETDDVVNKGVGAIPETRALIDKEEEDEEGQAPDAPPFRALREEVGEKAMDEYDSGGRSADKAPGAEDEGSTAPLPEKVITIL